MSIQIAIEGVDYSGKSTLCKELSYALDSEGYETKVFSEPFSWSRKMVMEARYDAQRWLLTTAARVELYRDNIAPLVSMGCIVIQDRYYGSSYAYQENLYQLPYDSFDEIMSYTVGPHYQPDYHIFLDVPIDELLRRKKLRSTGNDILDDIYQEKWGRIRSRYLDLIAQESAILPGRFVVDANCPQGELLKKVTNLIDL